MDKKRILVVDDEKEILKFLETALSVSGYEAILADSADTAMEKVVEGKVDLLLTDIRMPGGSGFDLKSLTELVSEGLPVVMMSGQIDAYKDYENTSVVFLQKPFSIKELQEAINLSLQQTS